MSWCKRSSPWIVLFVVMQCAWGDGSTSTLSLAQLQTLLPDANRTETCELRFLHDLGWRFSAGAGGYSVTDGAPCSRDDSASAVQAGDLNIQISVNPSDTQGSDSEQDFLRHTLGQIILDPATLCAFKFKLGEASRRAGNKLFANKSYEFKVNNVYDASNHTTQDYSSCNLPQDAWQAPAGFACALADVSSSKMMECVYGEACSTDCAFGRYVEDKAFLYELYGPQDFDQAVPSSALVVGGPVDENGPFGITNAGQQLSDDAFKALAAQGQQSLMGVNGWLGNVNGSLDTPTDRGENFVVVGMSADAAASVQAKGLAGINQLNQRIWGENTAYNAATDPVAKNAALTARNTDLADPIYQGMLIYVHPFGIQPLAFHIERLLRVNPRTPYQLMLGQSPAPALFNQYRKFEILKCVTGSGTGVAN